MSNWIKLRTDLHTDPAVIRLSSLLSLDAFAVVGRLAAVWVWADTHANRHGVVTLVSRSCLDSVTSCDGFGAAMEQVGWLKTLPSDGDGISFPHFERHMGEGAKARAQAAKRKKLSRIRQANDVTVSSRSRHGDVTKKSRSNRDKSVTRVEERREEDKDPLTPTGGVVAEHDDSKPCLTHEAAESCPHFRRFWSAYPRKVAKPTAAKTFTKIGHSEQATTTVIIGLERWKKSDDWTKEGGHYIPHPATFLNRRQWEDDPAPQATPPPSARVDAPGGKVPDSFNHRAAPLTSSKPQLDTDDE